MLNSSKKTTEKCPKSFDHKLQLQLFDLYGVPVPNTQFWITIKILKEGEKVTLQLPVINFQTGQYANNPQEPPTPISPFIPGGYLYTSDGFLPKGLRPADVVHRSWIGASDTGVNEAFSFTQEASTLPKPIGGYILQVTNFGGIVVQGAGTFGNIIPAGNQTLLPTTIDYLVEPTCQLKKNIKLSVGATNTTLFTNPFALPQGLRDLHINDADDGVVAWAWVDNSTVADKTNGVMNLMVRIGRVNKKGKLKLEEPIQLTDLRPPLSAGFDTAIAINRVNRNNIIVSYGILNYDNPSAPIGGITDETFRAVSFDGGKTFPINGPTNIQPTNMLLGDNTGVKSDKFGNIWYVASNLFTTTVIEINQPFIMVSTDEGKTYTLIYTSSLPPPGTIYDFPQYCFGGDGQGNYGLHFTINTPYANGVDEYVQVGFIPITGLGLDNIGTPAIAKLTQFTNNDLNPDITASEDGRVWLYGSPAGEVPGILPAPMSGLTTTRVVYKSPGSLEENYAGPWDVAVNSYLNDSLLYLTDISQPIFGYFQPPKSIIYDDKRQALYVVARDHSPTFSQNSRVYLLISRDNGQTWSQPIYISNSVFGNCGFQTMALDTKRGDLYFGWYDGRHDPTYKSVEYYGAIISAKKLDQLVEKIPLSNPIYTLPPATTPSVASQGVNEKGVELRKKLFAQSRKGRFLRKIQKK